MGKTKPNSNYIPILYAKWYRHRINFNEKINTRKIATEIVECINQTSNDYDAIEQIELILIKLTK